MVFPAIGNPLVSHPQRFGYNLAVDVMGLLAHMADQIHAPLLGKPKLVGACDVGAPQRVVADADKPPRITAAEDRKEGLGSVQLWWCG